MITQLVALYNSGATTAAASHNNRTFLTGFTVIFLYFI